MMTFAKSITKNPSYDYNDYLFLLFVLPLFDKIKESVFEN